MVAMILSVLQVMDLFLRTVFDQSTLTYGGTKYDLTVGPAEGNGAAPSGFLTVSTIMIGAYKKLGHGTNYCYIGAWIRDAFFLAGALFVDDIDLLHMTETTTSDEAF